MEATQKIKFLTELGNKYFNFLSNHKYFNENLSKDVLDSIKNITDKLQNKKYTVAVIAAMKAGKSTTFNALLGKDILPNESAACTIGITEIYHNNENTNAVEKHFKNGKKTIIQSTNNQSLSEVFLNDIRETRKSKDAEEIDKYVTKQPIIALNNEQYSNLVENFVLIDTPGPNEATDGTFDTQKLKEITYYQLRNADAIIFIFDYSRYKEETNAELLKAIFAGREDIKKDNDKLFFVVNKIDMRTSKDKNKEGILNDVKELIIKQTENIITNPQVLPLSALMAVYGREIIFNTISNSAKEDCKKKYGSLFTTKKVIDGEEYDVTPKPESYAEKLVEMSDILEIENKAITQTFKKSSQKIITNAYEYFLNSLNGVIKNINASKEMQNKSIDEIDKNILISKEKVKGLNETTENMTIKINSQINDYNKKIKDLIDNLENNVIQKVDSILNNQKNIENSTSEEYLANIQKNLFNQLKLSVENEITRKQDELIRIIMMMQFSVNQKLSSEFKILSKKANELIKEDFDISIETEQFIPIELSFLNVEESINIESKGGGFSSNVSDSDKMSSALKGAAAGAAVGSVLGPLGSLLGGLLGGIMGYNSSGGTKTAKEITYSIDLTEKKKELKENYKKHTETVKIKLEQEVLKINENIDEKISKDVEKFIASINNQLDKLKEDYEQNKNQKEVYLNELNNLTKQAELFKKELLKSTGENND